MTYCCCRCLFVQTVLCQVLLCRSIQTSVYFKSCVRIQYKKKRLNKVKKKRKQITVCCLSYYLKTNVLQQNNKRKNCYKTLVKLCFNKIIFYTNLSIFCKLTIDIYYILAIRMKIQYWKQGPTWHRPMTHLYCLDIFPTPQCLQNMPFIAYDGSRPSAGLGHDCSCLFS